MSQEDIAAAAAQAHAAKARFLETLGALRARLQPAALLHDAVQGVRQRATDTGRVALVTAQRHPLPLLGIAVAAGGLLLRHWLSDRKTPSSNPRGEGPSQ